MRSLPHPNTRIASVIVKVPMQTAAFKEKMFSMVNTCILFSKTKTGGSKFNRIRILDIRRFILTVFASKNSSSSNLIAEHPWKIYKTV